MKIIIDTREQKPLKFPGHETIKKKLSEGDYNVIELIPYIVLERKSLNDFYQSIIHNHARFKKEILRSITKNKKFYILLEGKLIDFYFLNWSKRKIEISPTTLERIVRTMRDRYNLIIVECNDRTSMSRQIVEIIEKELNEAKNGIQNENERIIEQERKTY